MISKFPTVSILIPAFNSEEFITETIQCVLNQSYQHVEIIVVDDGSTDKTYELAKEFIKFGVKLHTQKNSGASAARNHAFSLSGGKYILFLDADDLICAEHVASLVAALEGSDVDIAFGQWDRFYRSADEARFPDRLTNQTMDALKWILIDWKHVRMTQCGMFLIPRVLIDRAGLWNEELSLGPNDDFEFFARILSASRSLRYAPAAKLYYRSGVKNSLSSRMGRTAAAAQLQSLEMGIATVAQKLQDNLYNQLFADLLQDFIYKHFPYHPDLRSRARTIVSSFGGSALVPSGPPGFHRLRRIAGWRLARCAQIIAEKMRINGARRKR